MGIKASKNAQKYYRSLAKNHAKVANQRRVFNCQCCGLLINRDLNAAINLSQAPFEKLRLVRHESYVCGVEGAVPWS